MNFPARSRTSGTPGEQSTGSPLARGRADHALTIASVALHADPVGALYWPEHGLLAVADLHLEKGSSFAARGQLLPPYDSAELIPKKSDATMARGALDCAREVLASADWSVEAMERMA